MTASAGTEDRNADLLRRVLPILANATILTAMLVYFGWVRSEVQARDLGIDESVLGMGTRDYVLRSVRPVLVLVLGIGCLGLVWVRIDGWLSSRARTSGTSDRAVRLALRVLPLGWLVLPGTLLALGTIDRSSGFLYTAFPFAIGAGVLLLLYASHLRGVLPGAPAGAAGGDEWARGFTAIVAGVALFWGTSNYATTLGHRLAGDFRASQAAQVVVYGAQRLHITASGTRESMVGADGDAFRYRYDGLRLLEHTGNRYFLVSDSWTHRSGVVLVLADSPALRIEFVHG